MKTLSKLFFKLAHLFNSWAEKREWAKRYGKYANLTEREKEYLRRGWAIRLKEYPPLLYQAIKIKELDKEGKFKSNLIIEY